MEQELGGTVADEDTCAGQREQSQRKGDEGERHGGRERSVGRGRHCCAEQPLDADAEMIRSGQQGNHAGGSEVGAVTGQEDEQFGEQKATVSIAARGLFVGGKFGGEPPAGVQRRPCSGGDGDARKQSEREELEVIAMRGMRGLMREGDLERRGGDMVAFEEMLRHDEPRAEDACDREQGAAAAMDLYLESGDGALAGLAAAAVVTGAQRGQHRAEDGGRYRHPDNDGRGDAGKRDMFRSLVVLATKVRGHEHTASQHPRKNSRGYCRGEKGALREAGTTGAGELVR